MEKLTKKENKQTEQNEKKMNKHQIVQHKKQSNKSKNNSYAVSKIYNSFTHTL